jgi:hypothetical protein
VYRTLEHRGLIVTVQVLVGIAAWTILGVVVLRRLQTRTGRVIAAVGLFALASSLPVMRWDVVLQSESLAISLAVLLVAACLRLIARLTPAAIGTFALSYAGWVYARQAHIYMGLLLLGGLVGVLVVRHNRNPEASSFRAIILLVVVALGLTVVGQLLAQSNTSVQDYNISQIILTRVNGDPSQLAYFHRHGMPPLPVTPGVRYQGKVADIRLLNSDPAVRSWIQHEGFKTYARFLAEHPGYALLEPLKSVSGEPSVLKSASAGAQFLGTPRRLLPGTFSRLIWPDQAVFVPPFAIAILLTLALGVWASLRARRDDCLLLFFFVILILQGPNLWFVWHGAARSLGRLSIVPAVLLRVALVGIAATALDRLVAVRPKRRAAVNEPALEATN